MRRLRCFLTLLCVFALPKLFAQTNLTGFEYWINSDYANVQKVIITPSAQHTLTADIDLSTLPEGVNAIHLRYKDENSIYSSIVSKVFFKNTTQQSVNKKLIAYEYWFNNDFSALKRVAITPLQQLHQIIQLDASELPEGAQILNVRYIDEDGIYSAIARELFYKKKDDIESNSIYGFKYWFDDHIEQGVTIELDEPTQQLNLADHISLANLPHGEHSIHFQCYDSLKTWSVVVTDTVEKLSNPIADFTFSEVKTCDSTVVSFSNTSIDADTYLWDFGDGTSDSIASPSHTYKTPGSYNVTLIITDTISLAENSKQAVIEIQTNTFNSVLVSECDTFFSPSGKIWTISGTYTDTIPNTAGCDSIITIDLTVNHSTTSSVTETACDAYISPSGKVWTVSDIYTDTIPNAAGCDSIITIDLTIDCTNSISSGMISGSSLYPNPANDKIHVDLEELHGRVLIEIFTMSGHLIFSEKYFNTQQITIDLNIPNDIYLIKVTGDSGKSNSFKLLKQ